MLTARRIQGGKRKPMFDAFARNANNNSTTLTWTHTAGTLYKGIAIVTIGWSGSSLGSHTVSGVTFGGVAMTAITSTLGQSNSATARNVQMYYLLAPTAGANTVTVTFSSGSNISAAGISTTWSHVNQSSPLGTANSSASSSTNNFSTTVSTVTPGDLVLAGVCTRNGFPTPGNNMSYITDYNYASVTYTEVAAKLGSGGTDTASFTWTTADNAAICAVPIHGVA